MENQPTIRLYLASFLQPHNFGPGRIISICHGNKPDLITVETQFLPFIPSKDFLSQYYQERSKLGSEIAGGRFVQKYTEQLETFFSEVSKEAIEQKCSPQQVLPFENNVTLASWERAEFSNYRKILSPFLVKLGYEVVSN